MGEVNPFPADFLKVTLLELPPPPPPARQQRSKFKSHLCNWRPGLPQSRQLWVLGQVFTSLGESCLFAQHSGALWFLNMYNSICSSRFGNCLFNHLFACTITQLGHSHPHLHMQILPWAPTERPHLQLQPISFMNLRGNSSSRTKWTPAPIIEHLCVMKLIGKYVRKCIDLSVAGGEVTM